MKNGRAASFAGFIGANNNQSLRYHSNGGSGGISNVAFNPAATMHIGSVPKGSEVRKKEIHFATDDPSLVRIEDNTSVSDSDTSVLLHHSKGNFRASIDESVDDAALVLNPSWPVFIHTHRGELFMRRKFGFLTVEVTSQSISY